MKKLSLFLMFAIQFGGIPKNVLATISVTPDSVLYRSGHLVIKRLSTGALLHISYMQVEGFGNVSCNGLVVIDHGEAWVLDSPASLEASQELIQYLVDREQLNVKGVIATHFHDDCIAGLSEFQKAGIPGFAGEQTMIHLKERGSSTSLPQHTLPEIASLSVGKERLEIAYLGAGHTNDNMVAYYPKDKVLFGGCLIKELGADKGNLSDADIEAWPGTIIKVKTAYPETQIVVPGHGKVGDQGLLDYTKALFTAGSSIAFLLFSFCALYAQSPGIPKGSTLFLEQHGDTQLKDSVPDLRADLAESLDKWGYFSIVEDPQKADFILDVNVDYVKEDVLSSFSVFNRKAALVDATLRNASNTMNNLK